VHTPLAFLACYVVCGVCHSGDACSRPTSTSFSTAQALLLPSSELYEMDAEITKGCYALASFALLEVSLKPYRASDIACAILYYVRRSLSITPVWSKELLLLTKSAPDDEGFAIVLEILEDLIPSPSPSPSTCGTPEESLVPANAEDQSTSQSETVSHPPVTPTATVRTHDRDTDVTDNLVESFSATTFSPPSTPSDPLNSNEGPRSSSIVFTPTDDKENAFKGEPVPSPISVVSMGVLEGV
jgi:Cyclin, C-terminal domain